VFGIGCAGHPPARGIGWYPEVVVRAYGAFERSFSLPTTVLPGQIKAAFANGVLEVHLPTTEKAIGRRVPIDAEVDRDCGTGSECARPCCRSHGRAQSSSRPQFAIRRRRRATRAYSAKRDPSSGTMFTRNMKASSQSIALTGSARVWMASRSEPHPGRSAAERRHRR
jgi:hypothetical protein